MTILIIVLIAVAWLLLGGLLAHFHDIRLDKALNLKYHQNIPHKVDWAFIIVNAIFGPLSIPAFLFVKPRPFGKLEI
jgi:hypothetical protein